MGIIDIVRDSTTMVVVEKYRFGLIAMQLQEDITVSHSILDKYTDHKREYKLLLKYYTKIVAMFGDLSYKYTEIKYKTAEDKKLFYSMCDAYRTFIRVVSNHCFKGVGPEYVALYDLLLIGWESLAQKSNYLTGADKVNYCWNVFQELAECLEDLDEEYVYEHGELITEILSDWEFSLQAYTDMYNAEEMS